jgi:CRISPR-associated protein Cas1
MKRPYYLFSNGRLCRKQNTLCLERATDARSPGASIPGEGIPLEEVPSRVDPSERVGGDGASPSQKATEAGEVTDVAPADGGEGPSVADDGRPTGEPTGESVPFPVESAESIYCFGEIDVNSKLVAFLSKHNVPLFFFDYYGNYTASLYPKEHLLSGRLTVEQVRHHTDTEKRLRLARSFVEAALSNIRRVLRYYASRLEEGYQEVEDATEKIESLREQAREAEDPSALMGLEGRARRHYYRTWPTLLGGPGEDFAFDRRSRQPPSNPLNALISFGNSLCYSVALRQLYHTALDPTVSYLHEPGDRRFSLALDLAEVFKPLLVDRAIFRLVKTRQIQPSDFEERLGGVYLTDSGRRTFVEHWDERLQQTIEHRRLGRKVSYERLVRLDAYRLVRHLCDPEDDPYEGFEMWW